jgi:hypothetical protein
MALLTTPAHLCLCRYDRRQWRPRPERVSSDRPRLGTHPLNDTAASSPASVTASAARWTADGPTSGKAAQDVWLLCRSTGHERRTAFLLPRRSRVVRHRRRETARAKEEEVLVKRRTSDGCCRTGSEGVGRRGGVAEERARARCPLVPSVSQTRVSILRRDRAHACSSWSHSCKDLL